MDTLKNLLVPGSNALQDTLRLVVIGGAVETARRTAYTGWSTFVDSLYVLPFYSRVFQTDFFFGQLAFAQLLMSWHTVF
jgi:chaperone BCS1